MKNLALHASLILASSLLFLAFTGCSASDGASRLAACPPDLHAAVALAPAAKIESGSSLPVQLAIHEAASDCGVMAIPNAPATVAVSYTPEGDVAAVDLDSSLFGGDDTLACLKKHLQAARVEARGPSVKVALAMFVPTPFSLGGSPQTPLEFEESGPLCAPHLSMNRPWLLLPLVILFGACRSEPDEDLRGWSEKDLPSKEAFVALPPRATLGLDPRKVALGKRLFYDPQLSGDGKVSCLSCHLPERGYSTGTSVAKLAAREPAAIPRNVPTILNVNYNYRYNWDGEHETLETQLDALIKKPTVMASSWPLIVARLGAQPDYAKAFRDAYPAGITVKTVPDALIVFMSSLTTPGSRFDRYLGGDSAALSADALIGYELFKSYGCAACHQGRNVGGNLFERFGLMKDPFPGRGDLKNEDPGRERWSKNPEDKYYFRVPSLRNVALTAPYFHDGRVATLDEAVGEMALYQLGRELGVAERGHLVAFLEALTGDVDEAER